MHAPPVSIIICTRNRAESLRETLRSILRCNTPEGEPVEIPVVDDGATDHANAVVMDLAGHSGGAPHGRFELRYVVEPTPGQAHARSRGMAEARGEVFPWTDDDVRLPTSWIVEMTRPLPCGDADAVAGEVVIPPHLASHTHGTALERWLFPVASTCNIDFAAPDTVVGANMAFARRVLEQVPAFDVALGPGPHSLGFHDETPFCRRLRDAGFRLAGVGGPAAAVLHHVDPSRLDPKHLVDTCFRMGRSQAYCDRALGGRMKIRRPGLALLDQEARFIARMIRTTLLRRPADAKLELRMRHAWRSGCLRQMLPSG